MAKPQRSLASPCPMVLNVFLSRGSEEGAACATSSFPAPGGVKEISPARQGWVTDLKITPSAVGATHALNCHSEGIQHGCPKNLTCKYCNHSEFRHDARQPYEIIPFRTAYKINSGTPRKFNFSIMCDRCVSIVYTLRFNRLATSLLDLPSTTNWRISRSRGVSRS